jgi:deoxyribodipyrimidine photo-lyase
MTAILWLRRDLRVHDHPALDAALAGGERVVPVFCFDAGLLHGRHRSGPRTQFLLEALGDLDASLRERGSGLIVRFGAPERELAALAADVRAGVVHCSGDVGPYARARDARVGAALAAAGAELRVHPGLFVLDDLGGVRSGSGGEYTVFTPFYRVWLGQARRPVAAAPDSIPRLPAGLDPGRRPALGELGLRQEVSEPAAGGEGPGREAMRDFLAGPVADYGAERNTLSEQRSSRLSPYLHFGCISARELEAGLDGGEGAQAYRRQLGWRDFYAYTLLRSPGNARLEHQSRYRGTLAWEHDEERFRAWCEGRTGFPLIDAAMRQLRREGWMHNRARLVVGSFLTKDLGIDWRWGERWFMRLLIDGDEASNNGNWQWIASVGVDPAPPFRRMLSPARQQERFDPDGGYVRRYVEELREVPREYLKAPWTMPPEVQEECGCVIGRDYPDPIVDHAVARRAALARYAAVG